MISPASTTSRSRHRDGAVLLEVILALVLFVAAAAIIGTGMKASLQSLDRAREETHAVNLAISTLARIQMGLIPPIPTEPVPFESPFEAWSWELRVESLSLQDPDETSTDSLRKVQVVIRHTRGRPVHRLTQWIRLPEEQLGGSQARLVRPQEEVAP